MDPKRDIKDPKEGSFLPAFCRGLIAARLSRSGTFFSGPQPIRKVDVERAGSVSRGGLMPGGNGDLSPRAALSEISEMSEPGLERWF